MLKTIANVYVNRTERRATLGWNLGCVAMRSYSKTRAFTKSDMRELQTECDENKSETSN